MLRLLSGILMFASAHAFGAYTMIRVSGPPPGVSPSSPVTGAALNNNGVALVNTSFLDAFGSHPQAYVANAIDASSPFATLLPLATPFCCSIGTALNDAGQAAGYGYSGLVTYTAFTGTTAGTTAVPVPGWNDTYGRAINSSGALAGTGSFGGVSRAFVGNASGISLLANRASWMPFEIYVYALSDSGVARGAAPLAAGGWDIWSADASGLLGSVELNAPSSTWSSFWGPVVGNKSGIVAGQTQLNTGDWIAWVMTAGGAIETLPAPGTWTFISVRDINENGDLVGDGIRNGTPVYWTYSASQGFVELGPQFALPVTGIYALNDGGQILAQSNGALVLLTPDGTSAVPEPSSVSLLAAAGLLASVWRRVKP